MISKIKSGIDDFLWMDDDSKEDKVSYYKFGTTINVIAVAIFLLTRIN